MFISVLFTILFGIVCVIVILLSSNFRKQEFRQRLEEKALTTIRLLTEVQEVDKQLLKTIDRNTINKLYDEKTLVFDSSYHLIYSSLDDIKINWTNADLDYLKAKKVFFKKDGVNEIYGVFYDTNQKDYYALISANDDTGKRKIEFLVYLMLAAYVFFTTAAWVLCFYTTRRLLQPLDAFHNSISQINENNLENRLTVNEQSKNEIELIAKEFNFLLDRIEDGYQKQKEFTAQASHELRTPLARISAQLENEIANSGTSNQPALQSALHNINQLNELINSLLILSKIDTKKAGKTELVRLDETIYKCIEKVHGETNAFRSVLNMEDENISEEMLLVNGNQFLLETVFYNLLKNACNYSDNQQATITISSDKNKLLVTVSNSGLLLSPDEQKNLFQPFMRGSNAKSRYGLGLGLRMVERILHYYGYKVTYHTKAGDNNFVILF